MKALFLLAIGVEVVIALVVNQISIITLQRVSSLYVYDFLGFMQV